MTDRARSVKASSPSRSESRPSHQSPRAIAWQVLDAVEQRGAYANLFLPQTLARTTLETRDRAFVTDVVYTTLRWRGLIDSVIEHAAKRAVTAIDSNSLSALRLGVSQALLLDVPTHAAVSTTVDLVADIGAPGSRGFVNAVMRSATAQNFDAWQQICSAGKDEIDALVTAWSHPRWIVIALRDALRATGRDAKDLPALLAADNASTRPTLCIRPGLTSRDELINATQGSAGHWSDLAVTGVRGDIGSIPAIVEGYAGAQDEGSQVVALIAAGLPLDGSDVHWLDMCAGPGGKAAILAGLAAQRGAHLTAIDAHEHRVQLVKTAVKNYQGVRTAVGDSTQLAAFDWYKDESFDRVLVDAPCSGIGSLRRRPDLRWHRRAGDVSDLAPLQEDLLAAALRAVRVGGLVVYATCSPHISETTVVVDRARANAAREGIDSEVVNLSAHLEQVSGINHSEEIVALMQGQPHLRMWPHLHGTDGMFAAAMRRV